MIETLRLWWRGLSLREQRLLAGLGIILALMIVWLLLLRPLSAAVDDSQNRHARAVLQLHQVRAAAAEADRLAAAAPRRTDGRPVRDIVAASAAAAGLDLTSVQPEAGGVMFAVAAARPTFLFGWIAALDRETGLKPDRVAILRNDDATVSAQIGYAAETAP